MTVSDKVSENVPVVLLVNLGTPSAPTPSAIRRFLREFLSDRRVIEMHPLLWRPILELFVLPRRPQVVAKQYRSIWTKHGSPLMHWTIRQAEELRERLHGSAEVRVAMRYGQPSIASVLDQVYAEGNRRVLVLPAYPQYSATTVGTVADEVARWVLRSRDQVELRMVRSFETAPEYIEALARPIEAHWEAHGRPDFDSGDRLITSFHSIPLAMHQAGDPYRHECEATAAALAQRLELPAHAMMVTYQSVFGRAEWIGPATIDTVEELGRSNTGRLDVICPGFMADCLETLEEIAQLNREAFTNAGGDAFHYIPWGNDHDATIDALEAQARRHIRAW